jgi:deoxyribonuclease-4
MIRFGPSGIPLSCKGRTQKDGIEDVHTLGLNAMEIQFVRVNVFPRFATEEEIGLNPRDIKDEYIVDVVRKDSKKKQSIFADKKMTLERGDQLTVLVSGIAKDYQELKEIGELANDLDIQLSLHSPYYMDLLGSKEQVARSINNLRLSGLLARDLGAEYVVTHLGMYDTISRDEALETILVRLKEIRNMFKLLRINARLGIEISGKQAVFGSFEECLDISKRLTGVVPVINFAHLHARCGGLLKKKEDFQKIFEDTLAYTKSNVFYTHFSGVEHEGGNEKRYTPIKKGDLKFEPLADCILDNDFEITVISGSPLLEHDAMYMKVILERVQLRREIKATKIEKAAEKEKEEKIKKMKKVKKPVKKKPPKKTAPKKRPSKKKVVRKKPPKKKVAKKKAAKKRRKR